MKPKNCHIFFSTFKKHLWIQNNHNVAWASPWVASENNASNKLKKCLAEICAPSIQQIPQPNSKKIIHTKIDFLQTNKQIESKNNK